MPKHRDPLRRQCGGCGQSLLSAALRDHKLTWCCGSNDPAIIAYWTNEARLSVAHVFDGDNNGSGDESDEHIAADIDASSGDDNDGENMHNNDDTVDEPVPQPAADNQPLDAAVAAAHEPNILPHVPAAAAAEEEEAAANDGHELNGATIIRWLSLALINLRGAYGLSISVINIIITIINETLRMISELPHEQRFLNLKLPTNYYQILESLGINRDDFTQTILCKRCDTLHDSLTDAIADDKGKPLKLHCDGTLWIAGKGNDQPVICNDSLFTNKTHDHGHHISHIIADIAPSHPNDSDVKAESNRSQRYNARNAMAMAAAKARAPVVHANNNNNNNDSKRSSADAEQPPPPPEIPVEPPIEEHYINTKIWAPRAIYAHASLEKTIRDRFKLSSFINYIDHQ
jgi:hypothetical protein